VSAANLLRRIALAVGLLAAAGPPALAACPAPPAGQRPPQAVPAPGPWAEWRTAVNALTARLRGTDVAQARIAFVGDSITESWQPNLFRMFYGHRGGLNLGIGGDTTQSLLWRLENGHWPAGLQPQAIVLLIGTNNIGHGNRPEDVALGVATVIERLQRLAPQAKILLLGVLPRGIHANDPMRAPIARLNQLLAACGDNQRIIYSEPGQLMVDGQGTLHDWVAFDWLHLTLTGYAILSTAIEGHLRLALQR
jgi:lysophospholipase L1-like esterase